MGIYCLKFWSAPDSFVYFLCFSINDIVDGEYSVKINKSGKINEKSSNEIGTVMKNLEMLKFLPDYLKTKKCVSMQLKSHLF